MTTTIAFDVYGTLIDPFGVGEALQNIAGDRSDALAALWREKQLEYLFRRALGRDYRPFSVCTGEALDYAAARLGVELAGPDKQALLDRYRALPPYPEVPAALRDLKNAGFRNYAFSNGEPQDLSALLSNAGLTASLEGIVSVHGVRSYKPDPAVYAHFNKEAGAAAAETWLVSGNPFDVIGGHQAGWKTVWVKRDARALFDPWGIEPDDIVADTAGLLSLLA